MLAIEVNMNGKKKLVIGLYAPNGAKEKFFQQIKERMDNETYDQIIMMGDYNAVSDPKIDKTPVKRGGKAPRNIF